MKRATLHALAWLLFACTGAAAADDPTPASFAWRGTLDTTGHAGLVRVRVPADALARLQSPAAADLRVFDAAGQPVPFTLIAPAAPQAPARAQTALFPALPLRATPADNRIPPGGVQVHVEENGRKRSLWVQMGPEANASAPAGAQAPTAALFDTRRQLEPVAAFLVRAQLPANVPVRFTLATSRDLESWTPVAAPGRLFRFEGEGAPAQDTLELRLPLDLRDRYLRLDWSGQEGVSVEGVVGVLPAAQPEPERPAVALADAKADGSSALEWPLPFATPIARLVLSTSRENTVVPLRVLGRNRASEPWRLLGQTVVYRLGAPGQESTNAPVSLSNASVRWLRVEATHGARLDGAALSARVQFEPVEVAFAAGSATPYQLAAGREHTQAAALPAATLAATTSVRLDALPLVQVANAQGAPLAGASGVAAWLPSGVDGKTAGLWAVLALGVLVLGGVAFALLRQARTGDDASLSRD